MFKIKKETLEKVLNYLASKPFIEVQQLIAELQKAEEIKEKKEEAKK